MRQIVGSISQGTDRLILAPAGRRDAVQQLMQSAERTLLLSMFRCDDFSILDELASAVKRGVQVRVLITQRARGWREKLKDLTALLRSLGADVRPYDNPLMKYHAKYIVADDGPALVTSLNFTHKCFEDTCDFLVFSEDPNVVSGLKTLFERDSSPPAAVPADGLTDRLIVGPEDSRQRLTQFLSNAESSIRIVDHRVTDPQILDLLADKQRQGVSVEVIGNGPINGLLCHGRMILIDQKIAIIGSIHLSPPSLDLRRELAIVIEESSLVTELYDYFQGLAANSMSLSGVWASPPPPLQDEDDEEDE
jgi:phosphatidylserine/phosphatidylglycerophosphate/cardiolipin synthase-like enzyme